MEIDITCHLGALSEEETQRRWANRLCLYCGGLGHIAMNCPYRPKRQVNQLAASTNSSKPKSISLGMSDSPNSPSLANKFEIPSELDEELND
jgi:6-phosphogluconolactonase/glucosamine-6-phosphate isomerase/deaminase